jgi:1,4-dihydroxy-6-naphthoate synthase
MKIRLGHSPDPDDAFMFYALAAEKIDPDGFEFEHVMRDIQSLNSLAEDGELEITALSLHAWPHVAAQYQLTRCGGSFGFDYGPILVARDVFDILELPYKTVAVPGERTTAFLLLKLLCREPRYSVVPFDQIMPAVAEGRFDCGLIIHEGQITYQRAGLECAFDLGKWWFSRTQLPLPLGVNAIRRDLAPEVRRRLAKVLAESIGYGLAHRLEAVTHAMSYGRDLDEDQTDRFVGMYVNELTRDMGPRGLAGVEALLRSGAEAGLIPRAWPIDFVEEL